MQHSQEVILTALGVVKDVCESIENGECKLCPFGDRTGNCMVMATSPADWKFKKDIEIWRAFSKE